jgi:WD40 repeat protein
MGVVYQAEQVSLRRPVALKVMSRPDGNSTALGKLSRFDNEIQAAATLDHPNIAPIYAVDRVGQFQFYAMRWIDGGNWTQWMNGEFIPRQLSFPYRRPESRAQCEPLARMIRDVALALSHAHERGVIHRDIKPSNLLLDNEGHVWIVDFGLAFFPAATHVTKTGELVGTLRYMSPEQANSGTKGLDERCDIYSLGATFYELLRGEPLIADTDRAEQLRHIIAGAAIPGLPNVPYDLETILLKMTAVDPCHRYQSAADVVDDLNRWIVGVPIVAQRVSLAQRITRWSRIHAGWLLTAAAMLSLFVIGLSLLALSLGHTRNLLKRQLVASHIAEARALLSSDQPGHRFATLASLDAAANVGTILPHSAEDRDIRRIRATALSLRDLRETRRFAKQEGGSLDSAVFSHDLQYWTSYSSDEGLLVHDLSGRTVARLKMPTPPLTVCFSGDNQRLSVLRGPEDQPTFDVWSIPDATRTWSKTCAECPSRPRRYASDMCLSRALCALGLDGGQVVVVNQHDGSQILSIAGPQSWVGQVKFSPSGKWIAGTFPEPQKVLVWEVESGNVVAEWTLEEQGFSVAWDHDESRIAFNDGSSIAVYAWPDSSQLMAKMQGPNEIVANIYWHPHAKWLAIYGYDGKTRLWDITTEEIVLVADGHANGFSPQGGQLGFRTYDAVGLWEIGLDDVVWHEQSRAVRRLAPSSAIFANRDQWLVIGGAQGIQVWDAARRELVLAIACNEVLDVRYDDIRHELYVAAREGLYRISKERMESLSQGNVKSLDLVSDELGATTIDATTIDATTIDAEMAIARLAVSDANGRKIASSRDGGVCLLQADASWHWLQEPGNNFYYVAISEDGQWAAAAEKNNPLTLVWHLNDVTSKRWEVPSREGGEMALAVIRGQAYLLTSEHIRYRVWELSEAEGPQHRYDIERPSGYQKSVVSYHERLGWLMAVDRLKLAVHRVQDGQHLFELTDGYQVDRTCSISSDASGRRIVVTLANQGFQVWHLDSLDQVSMP